MKVKTGRAGYFIGELRFRIISSSIAVIVGSIISYVFYDTIMHYLIYPLKEVERSAGGNILFVNAIAEAFIVKMKVSMISGIILTVPFHLYSVIRFLYPALFPKERRILILCSICSFFLAVTGVIFAYKYIVPLSVGFLTGGMFSPPGIGVLINLSSYVDNLIMMVAGIVVAFQLPVLAEVLMIMDILKRKTLMKAGRIIIVGIFILSAVITPPDFVSQIAIAIPLIILYFAVLAVSYIFKFGN